MDHKYQVIDEYQAGNGYDVDLHGMQLDEDGNALIMIYDTQIVDMSQVVSGGNPSAEVVGLIIQEINQNKEVTFEWSSWDHFAITDTVLNLTDDRQYHRQLRRVDRADMSDMSADLLNKNRFRQLRKAF
jgi:hypothetical protein